MSLYLIPNKIADDATSQVLSPQINQVIVHTNFYLVENIRTARRFISSLNTGRVIEDMRFDILDQNTNVDMLKKYFELIGKGQNIGIISESGCPGIADPGAKAVEYAHKHDIPVVPLAGPSSIFMALMSAGLNGQKFAFHGYLPIDKNKLTKAIRQLESESAKKRQTQLFIETPYRNNQLLKTLLNTLNSSTRLCIATDITGKREYISTKTVHQWKNEKIDLHKIPTVFLFQV